MSFWTLAEPVPWPLTPSEEKSGVFDAGRGYDTSPQVGRCKAPSAARREPPRNQELRKTAALWSAPVRFPLTCSFSQTIFSSLLVSSV
jgi:hypothetical protein